MSILQVVKKVKPDEIYNLAAQSHVQVSFDSPEFTADVDATGVLRILEAVRQCDLTDTCRIYQASTSELYGKVEEVAAEREYAFSSIQPVCRGQTVRLLDRKGVPRGIRDVLLFGHPVQSRERTAGRDVRHPEDHACRRPYCSRKARQTLHGNLSSLRDWGYAKDYVECMWLILQNDKPEDFVIATGEQHSVREFCRLAFRHVGIELEFTGEGEHEKGIDKATGRVLVEVSPDFYRPTDVVNLWGDPSKAKKELGWNPQKTTFEQLVKLMMEADMAKVLRSVPESMYAPTRRVFGERDRAMMEKDARIYVAGHRGMVGSAIVRELERQGYTNILTRTHKELDLTRQEAWIVSLPGKNRSTSFLPPPRWAASQPTYRL